MQSTIDDAAWCDWVERFTAAAWSSAGAGRTGRTGASGGRAGGEYADQGAGARHGAAEGRQQDGVAR